MNNIIKSALPWLATALGGPLGGIAAEFVADKLGLEDKTIETVKSVLSGMKPEDTLKLQQAEYDFQIKMTGMGFDSLHKLEELNTRNIEAVNKTMQAEAGSEHWPTYSWRPFIGFMFGLYIASMFLLPLFGIAPVKLEADMIACIGAILGIASWFRGKAQADPNIAPNIQLPFRKKLGE